jgi:hypothetical protein
LRPICWKSAGAPFSLQLGARSPAQLLPPAVASQPAQARPAQPPLGLSAQDGPQPPPQPPPPCAADDRWTPPIIPDLPCPSRTRPRVRRAAATESVLCTPPPRDPQAKEPRTGYLKSRRPLDLPPEPPEPSRRLAPLPETLARARRRRRRIPPSSSFRCQGFAPEPRKEVSFAPVLHVAVPVHPAALGTSPEFAPASPPLRHSRRPRLVRRVARIT